MPASRSTCWRGGRNLPSEQSRYIHNGMPFCLFHMPDLRDNVSFRRRYPCPRWAGRSVVAALRPIPGRRRTKPRRRGRPPFASWALDRLVVPGPTLQPIFLTRVTACVARGISPARALARISHQGHGLRGAVRPAEQESREARCGDIGRAARRTLQAGERRPSGRAQAPARVVAGLNRIPRYAFRPTPGGSNAWARRRP